MHLGDRARGDIETQDNRGPLPMQFCIYFISDETDIMNVFPGNEYFCTLLFPTYLKVCCFQLFSTYYFCEYKILKSTQKYINWNHPISVTSPTPTPFPKVSIVIKWCLLCRWVPIGEGYVNLDTLLVFSERCHTSPFFPSCLFHLIWISGFVFAFY